MDDLGVDGSIILKCIFREENWGVECNDLAQDSNKWQAIVKTVINFRLP